MYRPNEWILFIFIMGDRAVAVVILYCSGWKQTKQKKEPTAGE